MHHPPAIPWQAAPARESTSGSAGAAQGGWGSSLAGLALAEELRAGIARQEVAPFYQPIHALGSGALLGFEGLARWQHPRLGQLNPNLFIPLAERIGAIDDLTLAMIARVAHEARDWPPHLTISVNISPVQLRDASLPERLLGLLGSLGFAPERLMLELTESGPVGELGIAREIFSTLRDAGVRIALDDFGAGSSGLRRLSKWSFDALKLDRHFIDGALGSLHGRTIIRSIVAMARSLGMVVVAEGVEMDEQVGMLAELGCEYGQGYLFGAAMSAGAALRLIRDGGEARRLAV